MDGVIGCLMAVSLIAIGIISLYILIEFFVGFYDYIYEAIKYRGMGKNNLTDKTK